MASLRFTSALYLGLGPPSSRLPAWPRLTLGQPSVLGESRVANEVADRFAALVGAEAALTATSTLHVAFDLFSLLAPRGTTIYADGRIYPISRWGIERAAGRGARVRAFKSHQPDSLARLMARDAPFARPPLIACDALCAACGRVAPLNAYITMARRHGGLLVIDESQAIGVLGREPSREMPYGTGGGGAAVQRNVGGIDVIRHASLAKGLGAPVSVLAASRELIDAYAERAETRMHCSPPSVANLLAARRALELNERIGDTLRRRLAARVERFRRQMAPLGVLHSETLFPVQTLRIPPGFDATEIQARIASRGVVAALTHGERGQPLLTLVITAAHRLSDIDAASAAVCAELAPVARRAS